MPMQVTADGDSIMTATGPYESVLRPGVQVSTAGVLRLVDGKLVGAQHRALRDERSRFGGPPAERCLQGTMTR